MGIFFTFVFGMILGGLSGYLGGIVDAIIQRLVDLLISIPTIPLWMALAAALPRDWPPVRIYFAIVIIFSMIGWTGLARVIRGKLLALREEDFVMAGRIAGATQGAIIAKHLLPSFASYIIVSLTLAIPQTILGKTALSFLGLGQPPVVSWGVLLQDAGGGTAGARRPGGGSRVDLARALRRDPRRLRPEPGGPRAHSPGGRAGHRGAGGH